MHAVFSLIFVVVIIFVLMLPGRAPGKEKSSGGGSTVKIPGLLPSSPIKPIRNREDLDRRLKELDRAVLEAEKKPPPPMAMCYAPMAMNNSPEDFVCKDCGAKTSHPSFSLMPLRDAREHVKSLGDIKGKLDERSFCGACNKDNSLPQFQLDFQLPGDDSQTRKISVTQYDLANLAGFFRGEGVPRDTVGKAAVEYGQKIHDLLGIPKEK